MGVMRLLATADLHFNHGKSRQLADEIIGEINALEGVDVVLLVGDTAVADGEALEQCLKRFTHAGPKLFVAGNHELWTKGQDSYRLFREELPRRVRAAGWQWLQTEPFVRSEVAIVGSIGWYDFSFALEHLGIPKRFYEQKISPGAAAHLPEYAHLLEEADDVGEAAKEIIARWNDGKFIKLHRRDEAFLGELLEQLYEQLADLRGVRHVVAAVHHLPFAELLPPSRGGVWDFARAFLGSDQIGQTLLRFGNVRQVLCGHSHLPGEARVGGIEAINIGSGYRAKRYVTLELPG